MKEDFLHYLWVHKKLPFTQLKTHQNETLEIIHFGNYLQLLGPDIFNAQIRISNQKWAGNIEIHVKSSDWYLHHHENNKAYDSIILHVVWEYDVPVFRKDNSEIPTLELKNWVTQKELTSYKKLMLKKSWINCEGEIHAVDSFYWENWKEKLVLERLERKAIAISERLEATKNDWEQVFFELVAKNFGLHTNGAVFLKMAQQLSFQIVRKEKTNLLHLEALFFGLVNALDATHEDNYFKELHQAWHYLKTKYKLKEIIGAELSFFKHRPDNFPTIRLAQLAMVLFTAENLFYDCMHTGSSEKLKKSFRQATSLYWENHYVFGTSSVTKQKVVTDSFLDLIFVNTIVPMQFCYQSKLHDMPLEQLLQGLKGVKEEKNSIIDKFKTLKIEVSNAYDSQALLQLKNEYCDKLKCLQCAVGLNILKK